MHCPIDASNLRSGPWPFVSLRLSDAPTVRRAAHSPRNVFGLCWTVAGVCVWAGIGSRASAQEFTDVTAAVQANGTATANGPGVNSTVPGSFILPETIVPAGSSAGQWSQYWTTPNGASPNAAMSTQVDLYWVRSSLSARVSASAGGDSMLAGDGGGSASISLAVDASFRVTSACVLTFTPVFPSEMGANSYAGRSTSTASVGGSASLQARLSVGGTILHQATIVAPPQPTMVRSDTIYNSSRLLTYPSRPSFRVSPGVTYSIHMEGSAMGSGSSGGFGATDARGGYYMALLPAACPTITAPPLPQQVCALQPSVSFTVANDGAAPFAYAWRRNGIAIDVAFNPSAATPTLAITSPSGADAGAYDCVVTNACGSVTSDAAALTVCACLECPADFNQDGGVDGGDVSAFFDRWETGQCDADVNADGGVDGADVDSFFAAWEAGGC
ncbi:MAG: hypothetical protein JSR77_03010 [Planctomycetes bacterium]|nr:hypothetical protein [Planctomycetota bacterium]